MDSQAHPLPHGLSWSSPLCSVRFPRGIPFFDPAGMLVDFDRGAVQHQCCFLHQVLLNQGCEDIFPYSGFCPGTEPAVHTLPWPEPLRKIPPWYSGVQPIQDCIKHFQITFSWPASLRLFFRRKLILDPIPLFFAYFMSFHVLYFIIFARCTQYISFKTDSNLSSEKLKKLTAKIPSLPEQKRIADILDKLDALCNDLTSGLPAEIEARQRQYEYYRDKLLTFKEKVV